MKKLLLLLIFFCISTHLLAETNTDNMINSIGRKYIEIGICTVIGAYLLRGDNKISQIIGGIALISSFGLYVSQYDSIREPVLQLIHSIKQTRQPQAISLHE